MDDQAGRNRAVARLAVRGAAALGLRQLAIAALSTVGSALLARFLTPAEYGVYGIVSLVLAFLLVFGDGGLGTSLVQQAEEPTVRELRQVFTVQLAAVGTMTVVVALASGWIPGLFGLPGSDALVFRLAALAVAVQVFQAVPMLLLERRLDFARLGLVSVTEIAVFYVVAVTLAARGDGARSVGIALLTQAVVGAALAHWLSPWRTGLTRDLSGMAGRLRFSLLYQGANVVSLVKDSVTPVLVGLVSGAAAVGYVSWAATLATFALLALAPLARLYLPVYARLQHDRELLGRAVELSMRATHTLTAPLSIMVLVLAHPITDIVFGAKWRPALPVFAFLWLANIAVPTAQPLFALLNAVGRSAATFRLSVMWMILTWVLTPPLLLGLGLVGFGVANALVQLSTVVLVRAARREAACSLLRPFWPAWTAAAIAGAVVWAGEQLYPAHDALALAALLCTGILVYVGASWPLQHRELRYAAGLVRPA